MKIAIANACAMLTEAIVVLLREQSKHEVIWKADNGRDVVNLCHKQRPDLLLLDIAMPVMSGVEATAQIMRETPCAILIVTSVEAQETPKIFQAMGYGALDAVAMTSAVAVCSQHEVTNLLRKINTIERLKGKLHFSKSTSPLASAKYMSNGHPYPLLLAIGASTGGPVAIAHILRHLPLNTSLAIVIVQHVDAKFTEGLAKWLQEQTLWPVHLAQVGEVPTPGVVFLAGFNRHLVVTTNGTFSYASAPRNRPYCPSIDVFFQSLAQHWPRPSIAMLLTGMGSDGACGLKALRERSWHTIAEHEKSCVVYGMPRAAVDLGAALQVLPCIEIPAAIIQVVQQKMGRIL